MSARPEYPYDFEIILGTYEGVLIGYFFYSETKKLTQTFGASTHTSCIYAVAANTDFVASGGTDEVIHLYDMKIRAGASSIMQQAGTVTCLQFTPDNSHLISANQDGSIALYRCGTWQVERILNNAHRGSAVNYISIHPSGKLALSIGANKSLKTWNLIKGRASYTTNVSSIGKRVEHVIWSTKGRYYAVQGEHKIDIYDMSVAGVISTITRSFPITSTAFLKDVVCVFGEQDGSITGYDVEEDCILWKIKPSQNRIKCLVPVSSRWLVVGTSEGEIIVFKVGENAKTIPVEKAKVNVGYRIVCMSTRFPPKTVL